MNILSVNTGDEKLDEAYRNFQVHVSSFDKFSEFQNYFNKIVKTDDKERLNKWLLKVLFIEFRYGRAQNKHDFDILLERVSSKDKEVLEKWLKDKLEKVGGV
jgi:7,8-dihydro-6-hydroxymethylpterin-pyrophosphokinase